LSELIPDLLLKDKEVLKVPFSDLKIKKHLGTGAFGSIDQAVWNDEEVAVKQITITSEGIGDAFKEWYKEVTIMR
jgi:hypothetical protein